MTLARSRCEWVARFTSGPTSKVAQWHDGGVPSKIAGRARPTWVELVIVPVAIGAMTGICVGALVDVVERFFLEKVILGIPGP